MRPPDVWPRVPNGPRRSRCCRIRSVADGRDRARLEQTQDPDHLAEDAGAVAGDRGEGRVPRHQPDLAVLAVQDLDGGLVLQQCGDDVSVFAAVLLAYGHDVAVAYGRVDHAVAGHGQGEQL